MVDSPDARINGLADEVFDALALLNIYWVADLAYQGVKSAAERRRLLKTLHGAGLLTDTTDVDSNACCCAVVSLYDATIEDYAQSILPEEYQKAYDHWGCACFAKKTLGWMAPRLDAVFAGESAGHFMPFDSATALKEYARRITDDI